MVHTVQPFYSGYVISLIGNQRGQRIPMEYGVAQANVASGTAAWEKEDEEGVTAVELDKTIAGVITAEQQAILDEQEKDRLHAEDKANIPASVEAAVRAEAKSILIGQLSEANGKIHYFLRRPWPAVSLVVPELLSGDFSDVVFVDDDGSVTFTVDNGKATYLVIESTFDDVLLQLEESEQPEVSIPVDWQDKPAVVIVPIAKKLRALDPAKVKMTVPEAKAIIEDWTTVDDQVREEGAGTETVGEGEQLNVNADGNVGQEGQSAEEIAKQKERDFLKDGDDDFNG